MGFVALIVGEPGVADALDALFQGQLVLLGSQCRFAPGPGAGSLGSTGLGVPQRRGAGGGWVFHVTGLGERGNAGVDVFKLAVVSEEHDPPPE